jgi:putative ABC transport system substrate-binding protein
MTTLGAAAAWPLAARAQQPERMRRIGVLMNMAADDPTGQTRLLAFAQALAQAGWTDGRNVRIDIRWGAGDPERIRKYAAELVALAPDVILASGGTTLGPLRQVSRTVPTVFTGVGDPVGAGFVDSLARPGGNASGFIAFEWSVSGKWLELLKEIAPGVTRAVVLRDSELGSGASQFAVIQAVAPSLRVEVNPVNVGGAAEIERAVAAFARAPNGGLIATGGGRAGRSSRCGGWEGIARGLHSAHSEPQCVHWHDDLTTSRRPAATYRLVKGHPELTPVATQGIPHVSGLDKIQMVGVDRS